MITYSNGKLRLDIYAEDSVRCFINNAVDMTDDRHGGDMAYRDGAKYGTLAAIGVYTGGLEETASLMQALGTRKFAHTVTPDTTTASWLQGWLVAYVCVLIGFNDTNFKYACAKAKDSEPFKRMFPDGIPVDVLPETWGGIFPMYKGYV